MTTVADVLRHKGYEVATISPGARVLEAAREMNVRRIGALVVVEDGGGAASEIAARTVVGIITERDVMTRLVAAERDPRATEVRDVMTSPVVYCSRGAPVSELKDLMRHRRIRHVPVIDDRTLCGMVSIGDVNAIEAEGLMQTITVLEEYITRG
jgi:CBS domain-containing protein